MSVGKLMRRGGACLEVQLWSSVAQSSTGKWCVWSMKHIKHLMQERCNRNNAHVETPSVVPLDVLLAPPSSRVNSAASIDPLSSPARWVNYGQDGHGCVCVQVLGREASPS